MRLLYSDKFAAALFWIGFLLAMAGGVTGVAGGHGFDDPNWAVSGPGAVMMILGSFGML